MSPPEFTTDADLELCAPVVSRFALDGGAMYGVIPRPMWSKVHAPDEENRVPLVARVLVASDRRSGQRVLFDAGLGQRWSDKDRARYAVERGPDLRGALAQAGVDPDTITHVVLSHFHWDHMGGLLAGDDPSTFDLAFPRAQVLVSERTRFAAEHPALRGAGSFRRADVEALLRKAKVAFFDDVARDPLPFVDAITTRGHVFELLVPIVKASARTPGVILPTDSLPTYAHVSEQWVAAYDESPENTVREKRTLFHHAFHRRAVVCLYHDPTIEAVSVDVADPAQADEIVRQGRHPEYVVRPASITHHPG